MGWLNGTLWFATCERKTAHEGEQLLRCQRNTRTQTSTRAHTHTFTRTLIGHLSSSGVVNNVPRQMAREFGRTNIRCVPAPSGFVAAALKGAYSVPYPLPLCKHPRHSPVLKKQGVLGSALGCPPPPPLWPLAWPLTFFSRSTHPVTSEHITRRTKH